MKISLPNCPKCGQQSAISPSRLGMSALPYQCPNCRANFSLVNTAKVPENEHGPI
jgi:transposase-like protein